MEGRERCWSSDAILTQQKPNVLSISQQAPPVTLTIPHAAAYSDCDNQNWCACPTHQKIELLPDASGMFLRHAFFSPFRQLLCGRCYFCTSFLRTKPATGYFSCRHKGHMPTKKLIEPNRTNIPFRRQCVMVFRRNTESTVASFVMLCLWWRSFAWALLSWCRRSRRATSFGCWCESRRSVFWYSKQAENMM